MHSPSGWPLWAAHFFPVLMAGVMPINPRFTSYVYILWGLMALFVRVRTYFAGHALPEIQPQFVAANSLRILLWIPVILFMAYGVGLLWTEDMEAGIFQIESKLSLLVTPWLAWESLKGLDDSQRTVLWRRMGWAFVIGWGLHWGWVWMRFVGFYVRHELPLPWRYSKLSAPFHPSYAAFYLIWVGILLVALTEKNRRGLRLLLLPLGGHLGLLASKAGWLVGGGLMAAFALVKRNGKRFLLMSGAAICLLAAGFFAGSQRVAEWVNWMEDQSPLHPDGAEVADGNIPVKTGSTGGRIQAWKAGWNLMRNKPLGVGTGDVAESMDEAYRVLGADYALEKHLNPHNQWLQTGVSLGWLGLLFLNTWWFFLAVFAWKEGKFLTLLLLIIIMINALFESVLELQAGIVFVVFWFTFGGMLEPNAKRVLGA